MERGAIDIQHLNRANAENYRKMRTRIGITALAFPIIVVAVGYFWGIEVKPTLSDYYYAKDPVGDRVDAYPVRLWFCGLLFIVGAFLWKYEGFSPNENRWLSVAGLFALGVAVFPTSLDGKFDFPYVHYVCAVLAFVCIAVVILWYSDLTLQELEKADAAAYKRYKRYYRIIGILMVAAIAVSVLLHYAVKKEDSFILLAEAFGIWAFAAYWFVKNKELHLVSKFLDQQGLAKPPNATIQNDVAKAM